MDLNFFGSNASLAHIGLAVDSIEAVCPQCTTTYDPIQRVKVGFISINGLPVELIEPVGEESPVLDNLQKGNKLLHVCYEVDDLDEALRQCRTHGFHMLGKPVPAAAFERRRIAFTFSRTFGLVELVERQNKTS